MIDDRPPWPTTKQTAEDLIDLTGRVLHLFRSPESQYPNHVGGLALARCRRLLLGMLALTEAGVGDLTGVLLRTFYESWMSGLYAVLGGTVATEALQKDKRYWVDKSVRQTKSTNADLIEYAQGPKQELGTQKIADRLRPLMTADKRWGNPAYAREAYEHLYRVESLLSVHGRLGSLERHEDVAEENGASIGLVREIPVNEQNEAKDRIWQAACMFVALATMVYVAFDLDPESLRPHAQVLGAPGYR